jgi:hypothetical protein
MRSKSGEPICMPQSRTCRARPGPAESSLLVGLVDPERAKELVRREPVVFAEIMSEGTGEQVLELHVMRPSGNGLYEEERDDTGPVPEKASMRS